ncbi:hypothetical protein [Chitinophaga sp. OAE865]|uniref:hypothetical protein n=1 Tax=Chitinophaga sp. OAE865 TaxID=2817898 RepID=UPI001AE88DA6
MKKTIHLLLATLLLLIGTSFIDAPAFSESKPIPAKNTAFARVHANLRLSLIDVSNIEVQIPTLIYTVFNVQTSTYGTAIGLYNYDVEVQEGDVLYLNSFSLPLAVNYTVTADDVATGIIHVKAIQ